MTEIHVDEEKGTDPLAVSPFTTYKTLTAAFLHHGHRAIYLVRKAGEDKYKPAAKSALKKAANYAKLQQKKQDAATRRAEERQTQDEALAAAAQSIVITEDPALPAAILIKLGETSPESIGLLRKSDNEPKDGVRRVRVQGRVHRVAKQGGLLFITLRRGPDLMQCLLAGDLARAHDAVTLARETTIEVSGELWHVPAGLHAPLDRELHADFFRIISKAASGDEAFTNKLPQDVSESPALAAEQRHLTLRQDKPRDVMLVRDVLERAFNTVYGELGMTKVSPPALVQTQVEGGATLFALQYYGEKAYLTQSSQLYLETALPALGDVYCIEKSFRAEKSLTRRHLSEYSHIEAELDFITFDHLLDHIEHVLCLVIDLVLDHPVAGPKVKEHNPEFAKPSRPFMRMRYSDAIDWLRERGIKNAEGKDHVFGDDIAEAAERLMTDEINRPILLTHFPVEIKAFYMQKADDDKRVTESVDVLMPGVGEVLGGSMRIWDYDELLAAYKREGIDRSGYYWYLDQRKYGSSPHGGYGLGEERFLAWLMKLWTVREACLYPRFMGRCAP